MYSEEHHEPLSIIAGVATADAIPRPYRNAARMGFPSICKLCPAPERVYTTRTPNEEQPARKDRLFDYMR